MPISRKVQSKIPLNPEKAKANMQEQTAEVLEEGRDQVKREVKRVCQFCQRKTTPVYFDAATLRRFLNDRGKIYPRTKSKCCAKHQRRVQKEIKRARHLALLPFTARV